MTTARRDRPPPPSRQSIWSWLLSCTVGNAFKLLKWSLLAISASILIEWAGMIWFWSPDHAKQILTQELTYLGSYNKNLITGLYPSDLGVQFIGIANSIVSFLKLREISNHLADGIIGGATQIAIYGIDAMVNTIFIFAVRSAICVSAITGFVLVGLVAFVDGLVERDIRRACGGIESAMLYHRAKRIIIPLLFLSFGGYLTAPISIHPTLVFLPVMALFAFSLFVAAKTFKKFL
jgi:integrating conjugative element membrane protein (TIGR03747 family)